MALSLLSRRRLVLGLGAGSIALALPRPAFAEAFLSAADFGLRAGAGDDQSAALQAALDAAAREGKVLVLPSGEFAVRGLAIPAATRLLGTAGATRLLASGGEPVARIASASGVVVEGIDFVGGAGPSPDRALLEIMGSDAVTLRGCGFAGAPGLGIGLADSAATIEDCRFADLGDAAIHSADSRGLMIRGNRIASCGNAGIRIWRGTPGRDGSIVTGNRIERIDWRGGGNGQNGNGINVFNADEVIVADNVISECAFTAVRVNTGSNCRVAGNVCTRSGEVAIFSEFGFSGSAISDNIIDGAATGIAITNLDTGGRLATCTGNIVRNISPASAVNPDTRPVGIYAEAETVVAANSVDNVPGIGIVAGYGPYLRNVVVADNVLSAVRIGIGVSVVRNPPPGPVTVSGNLIGTPRDHGIVGLEWETVVSDDLVRDAASYPHVTLSGNTVG